MSDKERAQLAVNALKEAYPEAVCSLVYKKPHELLIATRLSAQCTDARVNMVTPALFERYKTPADFAAADLDDVEKLIKSCGLFKTKARDIVGMCKMICDTFDGKVPDTIENLTMLPGIGRKTANLIMGDVYGKPAVVVDTHCIRITSRLGFHDIKDPVKIEKILKDLLPTNDSNDFCHRLVLHGRAVCTARNPKCNDCVMKDFCKYAEILIK
ncbi:MAG: endonuclease III [Clostridia bacterium]|nr:endonuclease III [Clostridia bacterium]